MAAFQKFNDFVDQLGLAKHNLNTDAHMVMLTSVAPVATNSVKLDLTEIAAGNGYTAGGQDSLNTWAETTGTGTLTGTKVVWTCVTAPMASFRYVVIYNDTQTVPADPLVGFFDYGSALVLQVGETFSVKWNNSETTGTMLTIA